MATPGLLYWDRLPSGSHFNSQALSSVLQNRHRSQHPAALLGWKVQGILGIVSPSSTMKLEQASPRDGPDGTIDAVSPLLLTASPTSLTLLLPSAIAKSTTCRQGTKRALNMAPSETISMQSYALTGGVIVHDKAQPGR